MFMLRREVEISGDFDEGSYIDHSVSFFSTRDKVEQYLSNVRAYKSKHNKDCYLNDLSDTRTIEYTIFDMDDKSLPDNGIWY